VGERVTGTSGRRLLDERGRQDEKVVVEFGLQAARALDALHRAGRVHGAVSTSNLVLEADGTVKLADPGFAPGTDAGGDLRSLGAALFELLTGSRPKSDTAQPKQVRREVGDRLNGVVTRLMRGEFANARDAADTLQPLADEYRRLAGARVAISQAPPQPVKTERTPSPVPRLAIVVVVLALVAIGIYAISRDGGTTASSSSDSDKAAELEAILAAQRRPDAVEKNEDILAQYEAYGGRHRGTVWEGRALKERAAFIDRLEGLARAELERIRAAEGVLRTQGQWRELLKLYESFPNALRRVPPTGINVESETGMLRQRMIGQLSADREKLEKLVREQRFVDALALVQSMEAYAPGTSLPELARVKAEIRKGVDRLASAAGREITDKYLALEARWREDVLRRQYRQAILSVIRFLDSSRTDPTPGTREHILVPGLDYGALKATLDDAEESANKGDAERARALWESALVTCESHLGDPASPAEVDPPRRALFDLRNAIALELLLRQATAGLEKLVQSGEPVALETFKGERGRFEARPESKIAWVPDSGASPAVLDPLNDLLEPDLAAFAMRSLAGDAKTASEAAASSATHQARVGLLHYYSRSGLAHADRALASFKRAGELGARGVRLYLGDLGGAARLREGEALAARLQEARDRARKGEWAAARAVCDELLRGKAPWIEARRKELEDLRTEIERNLTRAEQYRGRLETLEGGRVRVRYDFEDKEQAEAFEVLGLRGGGRWLLERGLFESLSRSSAVRWKHRMKGDVEVEYDIKLVEVPQNVSATLYYNDKSNRHYSATLAFDPAPEQVDPRDELEDRFGMPRHAFVKHPMAFDRTKAEQASEWEHIRERLVGKPVSEIRIRSGAAYHVKIQREGRAIRWWVDGKAVWEGEDAEYDDGYLAFYSDSRVQIDNLTITYKP
jgi:hypothetical protein